LNIDLEINNERQDCKIGTMCRGVFVGEGKVNEETKVKEYGW
jgi:hypothetical protein